MVSIIEDRNPCALGFVQYANASAPPGAWGGFPRLASLHQYADDHTRHSKRRCPVDDNVLTTVETPTPMWACAGSSLIPCHVSKCREITLQPLRDLRSHRVDRPTCAAGGRLKGVVCGVFIISRRDSATKQDIESLLSKTLLDGSSPQLQPTAARHIPAFLPYVVPTSARLT